MITEVARLLGVKPLPRHDPRAEARGWSPLWSVLKAGWGAIRLMVAINPLMGVRRRTQIRTAIDAAARTGNLALDAWKL